MIVELLTSIFPAPEWVPLFVKVAPLKVIVFPPSAKVPPAVAMVKLPATVIAEAAVFVLAPVKIRCP